jgi:hypothetical protein
LFNELKTLRKCDQDQGNSESKPNKRRKQVQSIDIAIWSFLSLDNLKAFYHSITPQAQRLNF